jgi:hypothetical protein
MGNGVYWLMEKPCPLTGGDIEQASVCHIRKEKVIQFLT